LQNYSAILRLWNVSEVVAVKSLPLLRRHKRGIYVLKRRAQLGGDLILYGGRGALVILVQEEVWPELLAGDQIIFKKLPAETFRRRFPIFLGDTPMGARRTAD
jgi:hypothetical protein